MKKYLVVLALVLIGGVVYACPRAVRLVTSCPPKQVQFVAPPPKVILQQQPVQQIIPAPQVQRKEVQTTVPQPPVTVTERTYTVPQAPIVQSHVFETVQAPVYASYLATPAPVLLATPVHVCHPLARFFFPRAALLHDARVGAVYGY